MPVVTVEMWEGRSVEQKRRLVEAMTRAMVEIVGANPETLHVIIREVPKTNWGRAGRLSSDLPPGESERP
jgi:4-oxalocrotonate tautomerase